MANKLKPCPFCGSPVSFNHNMELEPDGIYCQNCRFVIRWLGIRAKPGEKFEVAMKKLAEKWNRRAAQPAIIRCRDCKYSIDEYNDGDCYCKRPSRELVWIGKNWDFFCKAGDKREGESE